MKHVAKPTTDNNNKDIKPSTFAAAKSIHCSSVICKLKSSGSHHNLSVPVPHSSQGLCKTKCRPMGKSAKESSVKKENHKLKVTCTRTPNHKSTEAKSKKSTEAKSKKSTEAKSKKSTEAKSKMSTEARSKKSTEAKSKEKSTEAKFKGKSTEVKSKELSFADIEKKIFDGLQIQPKVKTSKSKKRSENLSQPDCLNTGRPNSKSNGSSIDTNENRPNVSTVCVNSNENLPQSSKKSLRKKDEVSTNVYRSRPKSKPKTPKNISEEIKSESNSDISDWEEVDELSEILNSGEGNKGQCNVQIELEARSVLWGIKRRKRRTEEQLIEDYVRKQVNQSTREVHANMHKTHLLCLLAHGMYINSCLATDTLLSSALSIIPKNYFTPKRFDVSHLEKFSLWFCNFISIKDNKSDVISEMSFNSETLQKRFENKFASNTKELVLMFVATGRAVGMTVRLVQSLSPLSWKPPIDFLIKPTKHRVNNLELETLVLSASPTSRLSHDSSKEKPKKKSKKMLSTHSECENDTKCNPKLKPQKLRSRSTSDNDFEELLNFRKPLLEKGKSKEKISPKKRQSSETVNEGKKRLKKLPLTEWAEVYVEEEEKWISVDVTRCKIHCTSEIEARCQNLAYVVAFNPDQTVKDVTKRYLSNWLSCKDKIRCDGKWWMQSLRPFLGKSDRRDRDEDKDLEDNLRMQPLPKTLSDYKNHPLYALQRHLLKFEAIYPPDETPIGFFRSEPVFPRSSVKTLYCREQWIKEAKTVRVDEEAYKVVKARPKWDKSLCQVIKDRPLELFGEWQVEDYEPPVAKNGKVPRNEYGNIELFKACMLPKGCVHLPVNGLNRIARKLNIDCAPALVGFEFHSSGNHPVYNGFVVCEEFRDIIMDAWKQEQFNQAKKEEEKRVKRIYDSWRRLIMGINLKDRLKERYGVAGKGTGNEELVREEKADPGKQKKKRIKQEDLDALSSAVITHSVPNLNIDFSTGVSDETTDRTGRRKRGSWRQQRSKLLSAGGGASSTDLPKLSSSDSEAEATLEEKREKIRTILRWNPESIDSHFGHTLSDESDLEETIPTRKTDLTPRSSFSIPQRRNPKASLKNSRDKKGRSIYRTVANLKKKRSIGVEALVSSSDSEIEAQRAASYPPGAPKRRSQRNRSSKTQIKYTESDQSESDISLDDSDTSDKAYNPLTESIQRGINL